jgi:hypothetical protein
LFPKKPGELGLELGRGGDDGSAFAFGLDFLLLVGLDGKLGLLLELKRRGRLRVSKRKGLERLGQRGRGRTSRKVGT